VTSDAITDLLRVMRQRVAEAEHAPLAGMGVKVDGAI